MRYTNRHFIYLLTYLVTPTQPAIHVAVPITLDAKASSLKMHNTHLPYQVTIHLLFNSYTVWPRPRRLGLSRGLKPFGLDLSLYLVIFGLVNICTPRFF